MIQNEVKSRARKVEDEGCSTSSNLETDKMSKSGNTRDTLWKCGICDTKFIESGTLKNSHAHSHRRHAI